VAPDGQGSLQVREPFIAVGKLYCRSVATLSVSFDQFDSRSFHLSAKPLSAKAHRTVMTLYRSACVQNYTKFLTIQMFLV
jgi:hypothetical protein